MRDALQNRMPRDAIERICEVYLQYSDVRRQRRLLQGMLKATTQHFACPRRSHTILIREETRHGLFCLGYGHHVFLDRPTQRLTNGEKGNASAPFFLRGIRVALNNQVAAEIGRLTVSQASAKRESPCKKADTLCVSPCNKSCSCRGRSPDGPAVLPGGKCVIASLGSLFLSWLSERRLLPHCG